LVVFQLEFSGMVDRDVLQQLTENCQKAGFKLSNDLSIKENEYIIYFPATYDIRDIALKVKELFQKHGYSSQIEDFWYDRNFEPLENQQTQTEARAKLLEEGRVEGVLLALERLQELHPELIASKNDCYSAALDIFQYMGMHKNTAQAWLEKYQIVQE